MASNRRETEATPGTYQRGTSDNSFEYVLTAPVRNPLSSGRKQSEDAAEKNVLRMKLDHFKEEKRKQQAIHSVVSSFIVNAPANDPLSLQIREAQEQEEELLREIRELEEENYIQEQEIMTKYRQEALERVPAIRYSKRQEHLLSKQFSSEEKKDLKAQEAHLKKSRKTTEAALHVLTRLPLLLPGPPKGSNEDAAAAVMICAMTELDEGYIKPLTATFETLRF